MANLPHRNKATNIAWSLLQKLIYDYELQNSTSVRKYIADKLLSLNAFIPQWLYNDYKEILSAKKYIRFCILHGLKLNANLDIEYKQELTGSEDVIQTYIYRYRTAHSTE
ncbi:nuclear pore complex protein Nup160 homolog [Anastrepha ludens]|uniref:nuclear pore complex protein Nup160 homolog n=1 Tax=Anastrepha ludens TaxID=28586 RepID=UPI0023B02718|nr:nuclear pore complex protein Nup160 homolog [Anastrepha ludens]XP_053967610.1 nuclear pore complex protein Nup160 homolog [Anastrepha ludens]